MIKVERLLAPGLTRQIFRYCGAGILVVGVDLLVYYAGLSFLSFNLAKGLSFFCGGATGYFLHRHWTFVNARWSVTEPFRFALLNMLTLSVNIFTNHQMLSVWPGAIFASWVIATTVTGLTSFMVCKFWVFRMT